jgi:hypothetical protein
MGGEGEGKGKGEWKLDREGEGRGRGSVRGGKGVGKRGRLLSQLAVKPTKGQAATYGFPPHQPT